MDSEPRGHRMVNLAHTYDVPHRVRWFLLGAYQGGSRIKRIARDLSVSLRKARRLLSGESVTVDDVSKMMRVYGPLFAHFITLPLAPGGSDEFTREAARQKALDLATRGGPLAVVRDAVERQSDMPADRAGIPNDRRDGREAEDAGASVKKAAE